MTQEIDFITTYNDFILDKLRENSQMQSNQELLCAWINNDTAVYFGIDSYKTGKYKSFQKALLIFNYYQQSIIKLFL